MILIALVSARHMKEFFVRKVFTESEELLAYSRNASEINVAFLAGLYLSIVE